MTSFWKFVKGILLKGETSDPSDNLEGSVWYNSTSDRFKGYAESAIREVVTTDQTQTLTGKTIDGDNNTVQDLALATLKTDAGNSNRVLRRDGSGIVVSDKTAPTGDFVGTSDSQTLTNKTIDGDNNTVQDLPLTSLKTVLADANKIIQRDASGVVISGSAIPATGDIVSTDASQTLTNKTIDGDNNTVQDLALTSLKTNLTDASKFLVRDASGIVISNTKAVPAGTVVGTSDSQTLTNKTIDADLNTLSNIDNADIKSGAAIDRTKLASGTADHVIINNGSGVLSSEAQLATSRGGTGVSSTATFPSSGVVVTRDATETLTNKTLTTPQIDIPLFDGQASTPANPSSGFYKMYFKDSDGKPYYLNSTGTETQFGSGSGGGVNYILNPDAETDTSGWATYADAAGTSPVDGTGGAPNVTFTRTTSTPLRGTGSFLLTKDAANRQGQGASYAFTIADADKAKVMTVKFSYEIASGTYADGDLRLYLYDVTNGVVIEPSGRTVQNTTIESYHTATFQTSTSTSYRLILHVASTSASAYTVKIDDVQVGPQSLVYGPFVSDWTSFTPTGSWSTNTTYTGQYRRVGDSMEVQVKIATSGAPTAANLTVNLPSGYSIDTSKLPSTSALQTLKESSVIISDSDTVAYTGMVRYSSTTAVSVVYEDAAAQLLNVSQTGPFTFGAGDYVTIAFAVPISGLSSGQLLSSDAETRVVAARFTKSGTQSSNASSDTVVTSWAADFDTHGMLTGSNTATVPVRGHYEISLYYVIGTTNAVVGYRINGGSTVYVGTPHTSGSTLNRVAGSDVRLLNAGDIITPVVFTSASITIGTDSLFSVRRISGPGQIAASEKVAARYTDTSGASITGAVFKYQTKTVDTHGSYSTSTGLFTCPTAGLYRVTAAIGTTSLSTTQALYLGIYKNNAYYSSIAQVWGNGAAGGVYLVSGTDLVQCVAGDTLEIRPSDDSAGAATTSAGWNNLIIEKVN